ncbi:MAG: acetate--CoA ligase family protein [Proteobacteria bacterium]|nr:acetate--CoA ligase family protein [Pseudomonadota bacterium]
MTLEAFFQPRAVAVVGASDQPGSVGAAVFRNLRAGGFAGALWPVNPAHDRIAGEPCFANAAALPGVADLIVICTPASVVPQVVQEFAATGTRGAVVLTAGLDAAGSDGRSLQQAMLDAARPRGLRILGGNCVGLRMPRVALNASFSALPAQPGRLALVAQSGGVITAFLSWAGARGIGFSSCVSLGNAADLCAADWLDALAADPGTGAILLYLESVKDGRRLIAAAQAAARLKPVFALKSGRGAEGAKAAATHTGALAGADTVWEAALLRAGIHRLNDLRQMYGVAEILGRGDAPPAGPVTVLTNSGGPAVLAVDALMRDGGQLAQIPSSLLQELNQCLPATWSRGNPIDIIGDALPARFVASMQAIQRSPNARSGSVLLVHAPTDMAPAADVNRALQAGANAATDVPPVACWMGEQQGSTLPGFTVPEEAVRALIDVATAQERGGSTTPLTLPTSLPGIEALRAQLRAAREAGETMLTGSLVSALLAAAGVPVVPEAKVATADLDTLESAAAALGYPLVLKILSPDITHKSDVGGVVVGIADAASLVREAAALLARCARLRPGARIDGLLLQPQVTMAHARELIVGISRDAAFGPVVLFGHGGTAVHVQDDTALGLAPLDSREAGRLIARTRVARRLAAWRDWPAADLAAVESVLVAVSKLALAVPEIAELDINPLLAGPAGVVSLDARIRLG